MGRTLVIGDLHGGLKGLVQALERAKIVAEDTLIFLGDYVDGWADSAALIQYLIELKQKYTCIFIRGNHDKWCEGWFTSGLPSRDWTAHGGLSTLESYSNSEFKGNKQHISFFYNMHDYYIDDKNRLFVHGGFTSDKGVPHEKDRGRLYWDRDLLHAAYTHSEKYSKKSNKYEKYMPAKLKLYHEIYVGHTTTMLYKDDQPMQCCNLWNLDTGAGTNGRVTVLDVDNKAFWQSDLLRDLYPNDKHLEFCNKFWKKG